MHQLASLIVEERACSSYAPARGVGDSEQLTPAVYAHGPVKREMFSDGLSTIV